MRIRHFPTMLRNFVHLLAHFTLIIALVMKSAQHLCVLSHFLLIHNFCGNLNTNSSCFYRKPDLAQMIFKFKMWKFKQRAQATLMNLNLVNVYKKCNLQFVVVHIYVNKKISGRLNEWLLPHKELMQHWLHWNNSRRANLKCIYITMSVKVK